MAPQSATDKDKEGSVDIQGMLEEKLEELKHQIEKEEVQHEQTDEAPQVSSIEEALEDMKQKLKQCHVDQNSEQFKQLYEEIVSHMTSSSNWPSKRSKSTVLVMPRSGKCNA